MTETTSGELVILDVAVAWSMDKTPRAGRTIQMTERISTRGVAVATSVVVASTGLTAAVHAVAAQPDPRAATTVSRAGKQPTEAADRHRAARIARAARAGRARERASRGSPRTVAAGGARGIAASIAARRYGWGADQIACLDSLWEQESGWDVHARNRTSGAYGIPQALPGSKMGASGEDWRDDATTQVQWGLGYIDATYGSPCGALGSFRSAGWY